MSQHYLTAVKTELQQHKRIISEPQLTNYKWRRSSYELCAKIISETLLQAFSLEEMLKYGTSISYKTLTSIFNNSYKIKHPMDPRSLCTLTKIVKFIGYNSWTEFTTKVDEKEGGNTDAHYLYQSSFISCLAVS